MPGAGSWSSPIEISDDEDDAHSVELELERRLASPMDDEDYDDWGAYDDAVQDRLWGYHDAPYSRERLEELFGSAYLGSVSVYNITENFCQATMTMTEPRYIPLLLSARSVNERKPLIFRLYL